MRVPLRVPRGREPGLHPEGGPGGAALVLGAGGRGDRRARHGEGPVGALPGGLPRGGRGGRKRVHNGEGFNSKYGSFETKNFRKKYCSQQQ